MSEIQPETNTKKNRHALKVGVVANILEWYEFSIYAYLAGVIGYLFFNADNEIVGLIQALAVFSISYLARPLGSIIFGYIGDKYGRSISLGYSLILMAIPTGLIGLLPIYDNIGIMATLLLAILRLIQGFAAGGELPATACYVYEISERKNRGLLCSSVSASSLTGVLLGSLTISLLSLFFSQETILNWAWRIPFLLGIPLTLVILHIRKELVETLHLDEEKNSEQEPLNFWKEMISQRKYLIKAFILVSFLQVSFYLLFVWMPTYLTYFLNVPASMAQLSNTITLIAMVFFTLLSGHLSTYISRKKIIIASIMLVTIFVYPLLMHLNTQSIVVLLTIQIVLALLVSGINGVMMETLGSLFASRIRCSGISISFTAAAAFFGGSAPTLVSYLIYSTEVANIPALYIIFFGVIALPAAWRLK